MVHQQGAEEASRGGGGGHQYPSNCRNHSRTCFSEAVPWPLPRTLLPHPPHTHSIRIEAGGPLFSCLRVGTPRRLRSGESISGRGRPVSCIPSWLYFWPQMLGPTFGYHLYTRMLCCPWSLPLFRLDADLLEAVS